MSLLHLETQPGHFAPSNLNSLMLKQRVIHSSTYQAGSLGEDMFWILSTLPQQALSE